MAADWVEDFKLVFPPQKQIGLAPAWLAEMFIIKLYYLVPGLCSSSARSF